MIEGMRLWLAATNAWIIAPDGPGGECVIVDVPPEPDVILARLAEHELKLVAVIATHGHVDHVGGINGVVVSSDMPVYMHPGDHPLLGDLGTSGGLGQLLDTDEFTLPGVERLTDLDDGQKVSGAGMTFTALHTPGHTQGSTSFTLEMEGEPTFLFSGDHLFAGGIGRTDLYGGSLDELMASMADKILPLDDSVVVLPGHGPDTTVGEERRTNPFLAELTGRGGGLSG